MGNLKGSRWTRIHKQGEANFEAKNNVMDITVGTNRCRAEITYQTAMVPNYKKAAHWLFKSLESATRTLEIIKEASEKVQSEIANVTEDTEDFKTGGENWSCEIEKMGDGVFTARMMWAFEAE